MKRFASTLAFSMLISVLTVGFFIQPAMTHALSSPQSKCGTWNVIPSPSPGSQSVLDGVSAISQSDIWAAGYTDNQTLTEHWDGASWNVVSSPNDGDQSYLDAVTAISTSDVWAVGDNGTQALTEHWDGSSWSVVASPFQGSSSMLLAVAKIPGGNNVWAVGHYVDNNGIDQTLIEQWDGSNWNIIASPSPDPQGNDLLGVVALSANDAWAVGTAANNKGLYQTLTEHWDGTSWSVVASPNVMKNGVFWAVAAIPSSSNVWAVGTYGKAKSGLARTLTAQWNGTGWIRVGSPNVDKQNTTFFGVASVSATSAWGVGLSYDNSGNNKALTEHWNGSSWKVVSSPNVEGDSILTGVTTVPASNMLWAVGVSYAPTGGSQTVTESYCSKK